MIRVLHLVQRFYVGGAERQFIERLRVHPEGFEPVVGCLEVSGGNLADFRALGLGEPHLFPLHGSLLRANTGIQVVRIARLIRRLRVRIVHGTDFVTNFLGLLAARLSGARMVVSRVDLGHARAGFGRLRRRVERLVSARADVVCANAGAVARLCIAEEGCSPDRVVVVRNGIDLGRFDAQAALAPDGPLPQGGPIVAVVANLWPVKDHQTLLAAADQVRRWVPDVRFALVGDGPEREPLLRRISELGLGGAAHLIGTRYDVPAILARSSAFCLPSRSEGLSNAIMEAMAAGLPVVATDAGGNSELVQHGATGFVVPVGDADAVARRLVELLSDAELARKMGRRGRALAERELSLERKRAGYHDLYCRLLDIPVPAWRAERRSSPSRRAGPSLDRA
ncbi:MAG TPA: glycosyltransferase [Myxococcales bacterium]|nr:glycosyltransferase [Myxococcales bacterium]